MSALETIDLHKRFGSIQVLRGLMLRVASGEVYGLLGPNGAGKTTLVHLLMGFLRPSGGRVSVLGQRPEAALAQIGYLPERSRYHTHCSARDYLTTLGRLSDLRGELLAERVRTTLELVGLAPVAERRIAAFSKGMLQRLGIAQALLHDPALLIIDEPTAGLDPAGQREVLDLLAELRRRGHTIFMCSHQLAEAQELCDRVGILSAGRLSAEARIAELSSSAGVTIVTSTSDLPEAACFGLRTLGEAVEVVGREVHVRGDDALQRRALRTLLDSDVGVLEVRPSGGGLEELYLSVTRGQSPPPAFAPPRVEPELLDQLLQKEEER